MKVIHKYELPIVGYFTIDIPFFFKPLSVQFQRDVLCLWAEVEDDVFSSTCQFRIVGTGHSVPEDMTYLGTAQQGNFVWHVYVESGAVTKYY